MRPVFLCVSLFQQPWSEVEREMVEEKGLDAAVAAQIGKYVELSGQGKEGKSRWVDESFCAHYLRALAHLYN